MTDSPDRRRTLGQKDAYSSPWSVRTRIRMLLWQISCALLFRPTPKALNRWRVLLLRMFGAKITGRPFVAASAIIKMPWNLTLEDRACLGPKCEVYNLGPVIVRCRATVAQEAYLCAGTHDFSRRELPLVVGTIDVGEDVFIGARAFVLPGVLVGSRALIGACAVVTRDVAPGSIVAGNPARVIGVRQWAEDYQGKAVDAAS